MTQLPDEPSTTEARQRSAPLSNPRHDQSSKAGSAIDADAIGAELGETIRDRSGLDLEQPCRLFWILVPDHAVSSVAYGGCGRSFGSIRQAIRFWADAIPAYQRPTAWITLDQDPELSSDQIERIHEGLTRIA